MILAATKTSGADAFLGFLLLVWLVLAVLAFLSGLDWKRASFSWLGATMFGLYLFAWYAAKRGLW